MSTPSKPANAVKTAGPATKKPAPALDVTVGPEGSAPPPADLNATQAFDQSAPPASAAGQDSLGATQAFGQTAGPVTPASDDQQATQAFGATQPANAPARPVAPAASGKVNTLGDFKLVKKLGAGGMGEVYKGHQISLDRPVAIKVMAKHLASNKDFVDRFYREARLMAKLDHPHIIRSFGVGEERGYHYLAMEFVDGGSLQDWYKKLGKMSVGDAVHIILACARALEHAHALTVVHRDIKPDNVLLTKQGIVKLADMGLAKATEEDQGLTQSGVGAGTPLYMAPEQAINAKYADARSDIYSLGCMLYYLLAGEVPFSGESTIALLKAKEEGRFQPVRKKNSEVPERLDLMIDKMIARKPESRYQSCAELIKDLETLGVASATLSFFGADAKPSPVAGTSPKPAPTPAAPAKPKPKPEETEFWQVSFRDEDGDRVIKKMSTAQIRAWIAQPDFDLNAKASRKPGEEKRSLAAFKEFEHALRGRLVQAKSERKADNMQNLYKQIEEEQAAWERWAWLRRLRSKVGDVALWLAVLAVVLGGSFLAYRQFMQ